MQPDPLHISLPTLLFQAVTLGFLLRSRILHLAWRILTLFAGGRPRPSFRLSPRILRPAELDHSAFLSKELPHADAACIASTPPLYLTFFTNESDFFNRPPFFPRQVGSDLSHLFRPPRLSRLSVPGPTSSACVHSGRNSTPTSTPIVFEEPYCASSSTPTSDAAGILG